LHHATAGDTQDGAQNNTGPGETGMGLEFLQMSPRTKQAVKDFIEKRESILYDA
jgi:c-di-GMP-binding flagellar brake protein YcgR